MAVAAMAVAPGPGKQTCWSWRRGSGFPSPCLIIRLVRVMWRVLLCRVVQATCRLSHFLSERFADSVGCTTPHNRDGFLGPKRSEERRVGKEVIYRWVE